MPLDPDSTASSPPIEMPRGVFELAAAEIAEVPEANTGIAEDEDDELLKRAIAISLAEANARDTNRYTMGGTNMTELSIALERSMIYT
jgi:hypothetical protein